MSLSQANEWNDAPAGGAEVLRDRIGQLEAELARAQSRVACLQEALESAKINESRFRALCNQSAQRMGIVELLDDSADDLRMVWVNRGFCEFYGLTLERIAGRFASEFNPSLDSRRPWQEAYWRAWTTRQPVTIEIYEARHDAWIQATLAPLTEVDSSAKRLAFTVTNITHHKRRERELRQNEDRWQFVMSHLPTAVWMVDRDLRITLSQGKALGHLGLRPDQLVGSLLADYLGSADPQFEPYGSHLRALAGESCAYATNWAGRDYTTYINPVRDAAGGIEGAIGIAIDVTDRILAEASLRDSEQRFRVLFEDSPDAIFVESLDGYVRDVNTAACKLHDMPKHALVGSHVLELVPPERRDDVWAWFQELIAGDHRPRTSYSRRSDGVAIPIELSASPVTFNGEKCILFHVRDITERQSSEDAVRIQEALERKMLESQKLESLGVLAGGIAHDFNNLLAVILGNASILDQSLGADSPLRASVAPILRTSERAADLCKQMLAYSGRGKFAIEAVDLNDVITEMTRLLEVAVPKMETLRLRLAANLPPIEADPTQIRQVVMNLVINAAEAIGDAVGTIDVSTSVSDSGREGERRVVLEVADSGCGMDEATRAKIFEPFFSTKFAGRGLGLATVQGIIRGHGGAISVDSAPGHGSQFRVEFKIATRRAAAASVTRSSEIAGIAKHGNVLVIDDEPDIRQVLTCMLKTFGLEAVTACDGEDGLERFRENPEGFVLVLLDLTMPRLNGEGVFQTIHLIRPELPVILMSGYSEQETASKFVGRNVAGFMTKPFGLKTLDAKVRDALRRFDR